MSKSAKACNIIALGPTIQRGQAADIDAVSPRIVAAPILMPYCVPIQP